jgi:DNA-directed RNA polymerase specialized sigma24 family protein
MAHQYPKQSSPARSRDWGSTAPSLLAQLMHPSEREQELGEKRAARELSDYVNKLASRASRNPAQASDDAQTFWLVVFRRRAFRQFRAKEGRGLRAYVKTIFSNSKRDQARAARVDALTRGDTLDLSAVRELPASRACPAEYLVQKLGAAFLIRCATTLRKTYANTSSQEVFRVLQGFLISNEGGIAKAAVLLNISEPAVHYRKDQMRTRYRNLVIKERRKLGASAQELDQMSKAFDDAWQWTP